MEFEIEYQRKFNSILYLKFQESFIIENKRYLFLMLEVEININDFEDRRFQKFNYVLNNVHFFYYYLSKLNLLYHFNE